MSETPDYSLRFQTVIWNVIRKVKTHFVLNPMSALNGNEISTDRAAVKDRLENTWAAEADEGPGKNSCVSILGSPYLLLSGLC